MQKYDLISFIKSLLLEIYNLFERIIFFIPNIIQRYTAGRLLTENSQYPPLNYDFSRFIDECKYKTSKFHITTGDLYARDGDIEIHEFSPPEGKELKGSILYRHGLCCNFAMDFEPVILTLVKNGYRVFSWDNLGVANNTGATKDFATSLNVGRQISKHIIEDVIGQQDEKEKPSPVIFMGCSLGGYEMLHTAKYIENEFKDNEKYKGNFKLIDYNSFSSVNDIFMRKKNITNTESVNYISRLFNFLISCIQLILNFFLLRINGNAKEILKDLEMPVLVINIDKDKNLKGGTLFDVLDSGVIKDKQNISSVLLDGDDHCFYDLEIQKNLVRYKNIDLSSSDNKGLPVSTNISATNVINIAPIDCICKFVANW